MRILQVFFKHLKRSIEMPPFLTIDFANAPVLYVQHWSQNQWLHVERDMGKLAFTDLISLKSVKHTEQAVGVLAPPMSSAHSSPLLAFPLLKGPTVTSHLWSLAPKTSRRSASICFSLSPTSNCLSDDKSMSIFSHSVAIGS